MQSKSTACPNGVKPLACRAACMPTGPQLTLQEGDVAPDFTAMTTGGETVSLGGFKGRRVVLYFYPRDDTPGCTKEACAFRDDYADFQKLDTTVLGVSTDSRKSHQKFTEKYKLPFPLLVVAVEVKPWD